MKIRCQAFTKLTNLVSVSSVYNDAFLVRERAMVYNWF